jgi:predicted nucleotidyltransferase component of viral defense system
VIKNKAASVNTRLRNLARKLGVDYNRIELLYFQERLLARLAVSDYRDNFVLKGALFLYGRYQSAARPTRDVDVLGLGLPSDVDQMIQIFSKVAAIDLEDGVVFGPEGVTGQRIKEGAAYEAVRLKLMAHLGQARQVLQLDVGFGDKVIPAPQVSAYPTLLDDQPPRLLTYTLESVVAEKFEALVMLYNINTRMKDFYDLYQIVQKESIDTTVLRQAIEQTFRRRNTPLSNASKIFEPAFTEDVALQRQWEAYWRSLRPEDRLEFQEVMKVIREALEPLV